MVWVILITSKATGGANTTQPGARLANAHTLQTMTTLSNLISALIIVESSGNDQAIGDNGRALGPLQIHRGVVLDVNRITGSHYRHSEMTNRVAARAVCEAYLKHWGKGKTTEEQARIWNAGPQGHKKKTATQAYWLKVQRNLK